MSTLKKTATGTVLGGALLVAGGMGLAAAAPEVPEAQTAGDGSVNVAVTAADGERIGVLQDVSVANAFTLANSVCPISGITQASLSDLDVNGTAVTQTCGGLGGLTFTFGQNGPGASELAPGQNQSPEAPAPITTAPITTAPITNPVAPVQQGG